jgi:hypothetical protein
MKKILQMSIVATMGMTLFSYILSLILKEKFLETEILNQLIFPNNKEARKNHPAGYVIHFTTGTFFASIYRKLWDSTHLQPNLSTGATMGFINGLAGISVWHVILRLHSNPPDVNFKRFYLQLLFAHIIFGLINSFMFLKKTVV